MIIGISGKAGAGKDSLLLMLQEINPNVRNVKFSGALKQQAGKMIGVTPSKFEDQEFKASDLSEGFTVRDFLIELGMLGRRVNQDYWVIKAMEEADMWVTEGGSEIVFTDMRFPNELKAIKDAGGVTIRINRVGCDGVDHESDTALDDADFDYVIHNGGTLDDLRTSAKEIAKEFGWEVIN